MSALITIQYSRVPEEKDHLRKTSLFTGCKALPFIQRVIYAIAILSFFYPLPAHHIYLHLGNSKADLWLDCVVFITFPVVTVVADVRLNGTSNCAGTLEIQHQGKWRPADGGFHWDLKASSVVCRQLNCGSAVSTQRSAWFTREPVWTITPYCAGSERSLSDCVVTETSHNARKGLVAGRPTVTCSGNSTT